MYHRLASGLETPYFSLSLSGARFDAIGTARKVGDFLLTGYGAAGGRHATLAAPPP